MANDNEKLDVPATDKPVVVDRPSFLKDLKNGLVHALKVVWQVPEARGMIATLLVRFGVPASIAAIGMAVGEKLAQ